MLDKLFTEIPLTEGEKELIELSNTDQTKQISKSKVVSDLYNVSSSNKCNC